MERHYKEYKKGWCINVDYLHIIFIGGGKAIRNCVDRNQFEKIYKPKGWVIDEEYQEKPTDENIKNFKYDEEIKNYNEMKKPRNDLFDDGLFKKD